MKQILLFSIITSVAVYGLYLSSLRAAMLGVILCFVLIAGFLVYRMVMKGESLAVRRWQLVGMFLTIILTSSFIIIIPKPEIIENRFDNLTQIEDFKFGGDEPIHSRIEELRISKELFLTHPIFGVGFGGYRSYNEFTDFVKYPHNIFVEMAVEGGIIGLLVLGALFVVIFKSVYRYSLLFFIFLLFSLFLTLFSKELSNQALLWIFIAFIGMNLNTKKN